MAFCCRSIKHKEKGTPMTDAMQEHSLAEIKAAMDEISSSKLERQRVKAGEALSRVAREPGMGRRSGTGSRLPRTASSTRPAAKSLRRNKWHSPAFAPRMPGSGWKTKF
jgi:hypothetical protein